MCFNKYILLEFLWIVLLRLCFSVNGGLYFRCGDDTYLFDKYDPSEFCAFGVCLYS